MNGLRRSGEQLPVGSHHSAILSRHALSAPFIRESLTNVGIVLMNYLLHYFVRLWLHVKHRKAGQLALLLSIVFGMIRSSGEAAPITLAFEARIDEVISGIPFDLGLDYHVGDVVSGKFTFHPLAGDGGMYLEAPQLHELSLNINGNVFWTPQFGILSVNNGLMFEPPPAIVVDRLHVGSGKLAAAFPAAFPNLDPTQSGLKMELWGTLDVLPSASIPANVADWNALILQRRLTVFFANGTGDLVGFFATVGPFTTIPEPGIPGLVLILVLLFLLKRH